MRTKSTNCVSKVKHNFDKYAHVIITVGKVPNMKLLKRKCINWSSQHEYREIMDIVFDIFKPKEGGTLEHPEIQGMCDINPFIYAFEKWYGSGLLWISLEVI